MKAEVPFLQIIKLSYNIPHTDFLGIALSTNTDSAGKFMKVSKQNECLFSPSKTGSLISLASSAISSMQRAQGLLSPPHNKDRLESSRRQRDKNLQLQLKQTRGSKIET